jgi:hypothetical protein
VSKKNTLKTIETKESVTDFINSIKDEVKRKDTKQLVKIMQKITGEKPKIWGSGMIGFGNYKYKRKGGKDEYEWFNVGFAPRKDKITIYVSCYLEKFEDLLKKLGKCKWGKGCLYIKKLDDIDLKVLEKLIKKNKGNQWGTC